MLFLDRHEVDQRDFAALRRKDRLQNERSRTIAALDSRRGFGRDQRSSVLGCAQQGCEAGAGIETRETKPVDRAIVADKRGGAHVADQGIIFDQSRHSDPLTKPAAPLSRLPAARSRNQIMSPSDCTRAAGKIKSPSRARRTASDFSSPVTRNATARLD